MSKQQKTKQRELPGVPQIYSRARGKLTGYWLAISANRYEGSPGEVVTDDYEEYVITDDGLEIDIDD